MSEMAKKRKYPLLQGFQKGQKFTEEHRRKIIEFRQDSLEHKIPLSRNGTNEYNNLAIAHRSCNCKKHNKTEGEFKICKK